VETPNAKTIETLRLFQQSAKMDTVIDIASSNAKSVEWQTTRPN
jgi:hypothetical protein